MIMHTLPIRWFRLTLSLVLVMAAALLMIHDVQAGVQSQSSDLSQGSQLVYSVANGTAEASIAQDVDYASRQAIDWPKVGNWAWARGREIITFLVFGLLAIWLFPKQLNRTVERLRTSPGKSTGVGLLVLIVGYTAAFLLALVVVGLFIFFLFISFKGLGWAIFSIGLSAWGLLLAAFSLIVSYISKLVVAFFIGKWLLEKLFPKAKRNIWPLLVGVLLYVLICSIPWLGWVIGAIATLMGLGAIWLAFRDRRFIVVEQNVEAAPPETVESSSEPAVEEGTDEPVEQLLEAPDVEVDAEQVANAVED
jgi:hypothetical protein